MCFIWRSSAVPADADWLAEFDARSAKLKAEGIKFDDSGRAALEATILRQPTWIEYSGSFLPGDRHGGVLLCVLLSFTNRSKFHRLRWSRP